MIVLKALLLLALLTYAAFIALLYFSQNRLLYHPSGTDEEPRSLGLADVQSLTLTTAQGHTLRAWYKPASPGQKTILYLPGNAGSLAERADKFRFYLAHGFGLLSIAYPGFPGSSGQSSEAGLLAAGKAAYDWLLNKQMNPENIVLVGESLGTGLAVRLAASEPVAGLALEAPYAAVVDIAASQFWFAPVRLLMRDQYRSIDYIGNVHVPLLIQHGALDDTVPFSEGERLFQAANQPKTFIKIEHKGHDVLADTAVWQREIDFIRTLKN